MHYTGEGASQSGTIKLLLRAGARLDISKRNMRIKLAGILFQLVVKRNPSNPNNVFDKDSSKGAALQASKSSEDQDTSQPRKRTEGGEAPPPPPNNSEDPSPPTSKESLKDAASSQVRSRVTRAHDSFSMSSTHSWRKSEYVEPYSRFAGTMQRWEVQFAEQQRAYRLTLIEWLLAAGVPPDIEGYGERTLGHIAASYGDKAVRYMLACVNSVCD